MLIGMGNRFNGGEAACEPQASQASAAPRSSAPMVRLQLGGSGNRIECSFVEDDARMRYPDAVDRACHAIDAPMAHKPNRYRGDAAGISERTAHQHGPAATGFFNGGCCRAQQLRVWRHEVKHGKREPWRGSTMARQLG